MDRNGIDAYRQINVTTAGPGRLILICYEGAISSLKAAREKYISREYEAKAETVQKAQSIISGLIQALDFENGDKIAKNLDALYNYMLRRIIEGDVKGDIRAFDEVIMMLGELESAWKEISRVPENPCFIYDDRWKIPTVQGVAGVY